MAARRHRQDSPAPGRSIGLECAGRLPLHAGADACEHMPAGHGRWHMHLRIQTAGIDAELALFSPTAPRQTRASRIGMCSANNTPSCMESAQPAEHAMALHCINNHRHPPASAHPQQSARPLVSSPQVWYSAPEMALKTWPPLTGTGTSEDRVLLFPSLPLVPSPQQNAAPAAVRAHEWCPPQLSWVNTWPPGMRVGTAPPCEPVRKGSVEAQPAWGMAACGAKGPVSASHGASSCRKPCCKLVEPGGDPQAPRAPQQKSSPTAVRAQLCQMPEQMEVNFRPSLPVGGAGVMW